MVPCLIGNMFKQECHWDQFLGLCYLVYLNDITDGIQSTCFLYANDTSLLEIVEDSQLTSAKLNSDLTNISKWTRDWLVTINPSKTEHPALYYEGNEIDTVSSHKHLGVTLSSNLFWRTHILNIHDKASKRLNLLKGLKLKINRNTLDKLYKSLIRPLMEYADVVWDGCCEKVSDLLESVQYEFAKVVSGAMKGTGCQRLLEELA